MLAALDPHVLLLTLLVGALLAVIGETLTTWTFSKLVQIDEVPQTMSDEEEKVSWVEHDRRLKSNRMELSKLTRRLEQDLHERRAAENPDGTHRYPKEGGERFGQARRAQG